MQTKVTNEFDNSLYERKELTLEITSKTAPSKEEIINFVSEKFKTSPDAIRILKVESNFGINIFKALIHAYKDKSSMMKTENFSKKEKEKIKKVEDDKKVAEEAAKAQNEKPVENPEEKPVEESSKEEASSQEENKSEDSSAPK